MTTKPPIPSRFARSVQYANGQELLEAGLLIIRCLSTTKGSPMKSVYSVEYTCCNRLGTLDQEQIYNRIIKNRINCHTCGLKKRKATIKNKPPKLPKERKDPIQATWPVPPSRR